MKRMRRKGKLKEAFGLIGGIFLLSGCLPQPSLTPQADYDVHFLTPSAYYGKEGYEEGATIKDNNSYTTFVRWIEVNDNHLYCEYTLPKSYEEGQTIPSIILVHGFNSNHFEWNAFVPFLVSSGFAIAAIDCRGGQRSDCRSDGTLVEMTLDSQIHDVQATTQYMKSQKEVDPSNLFLMGHSQGGLIASLAASTAKIRNDLCGLISLSGGYTIIDDIVYGYDENNLPESPTLLETEIGKGYLESAFRHRNYRTEITYFQGSVLLAVGENDNMVSPDSVESIYQQSYSSQGYFYKVPNAGHGFSALDLQSFYPEVLEPFLLNAKIK